MLLSIIIVSYNTKDLTLNTIKSITKTTQSSKVFTNNLEIIVVDNNSKDDSVVALNKLKKELSVSLIIIDNKKNVGFGNANNQGITSASGEYLLFLNSDTIVQKNALENMVQRFLIDAENTSESLDRLGILSPILLNMDRTYQPQGGSFPTLFSLFFHMSMLDDIPIIGKYLPSTQHTGKSNRTSLQQLEQETKLIPVDWVAGTALMVSKTVIETIGAFDQNIFMYGEDVELCMRAKNHHYLISLDPTSRIIHLQSKSSNSENAIRGEFKGYHYIFSKHASAFEATIAKMILQLGAYIRLFVFSTLAPNPEKIQIYRNVLSDLEQ